MSQAYPRSDASTGIALSWCVALVLAPLALGWCIGVALRDLVVRKRAA